MKKPLFDSQNINPWLSLILGYLAICGYHREIINPFPIIGDFFTGIFNGEVGIGEILSTLFFLFLILWLGMLVTIFIVKPIYLITTTFAYTYQETFMRVRYENFFYWLIALPFRLTFLPIIRSVLTIAAGGEKELDSTVKRMRIETLERMINRIHEQLGYAAGSDREELEAELANLEAELYQIRNQ